MERKYIPLAVLLLASAAACTSSTTAPEQHVPEAALWGINGLGGGYVEPTEVVAGDGGAIGSGNEVAGDTTEVGRGINGMGGG